MTAMLVQGLTRIASHAVRRHLIHSNFSFLPTIRHAIRHHRQFTASKPAQATHAPNVSLDPQSELAREWFEKGGIAWQNGIHVGWGIVVAFRHSTHVHVKSTIGDLEQALECYEKSHWSKANADAVRMSFLVVWVGGRCGRRLRRGL